MNSLSSSLIVTNKICDSVIKTSAIYIYLLEICESKVSLLLLHCQSLCKIRKLQIYFLELWRQTCDCEPKWFRIPNSSGTIWSAQWVTLEFGGFCGRVVIGWISRGCFLQTRRVPYQWICLKNWTMSWLLGIFKDNCRPHRWFFNCVTMKLFLFISESCMS